MKSFKELIVWQKSILLVKEIYKVTYKFPKSELYGLVSQMQRAAISIPSNIAEGFGRRSTKENQQFISIALGSLDELETQLILAKELGFCSLLEITAFDEPIAEIRRMLISLRYKLNQNA